MEEIHRITACCLPFTLAAHYLMLTKYWFFDTLADFLIKIFKNFLTFLQCSASYVPMHIGSTKNINRRIGPVLGLVISWFLFFMVDITHLFLAFFFWEEVMQIFFSIFSSLALLKHPQPRSLRLSRGPHCWVTVLCFSELWYWVRVNMCGCSVQEWFWKWLNWFWKFLNWIPVHRKDESLFVKLKDF